MRAVIQAVSSASVRVNGVQKNPFERTSGIPQNIGEKS